MYKYALKPVHLSTSFNYTHNLIIFTRLNYPVSFILVFSRLALTSQHFISVFITNTHHKNLIKQHLPGNGWLCRKRFTRKC